jgi:reactive chlorine resistance protein C
MQDLRCTTNAARLIERSGRVVALAGVVLPLLLIGGLKFTQIEVAALKPLIGGTPWLAWMQAAFGPERACYLIGLIEITTGLLLVASAWSRRAALAGGALAAVTFVVTTSLLLILPVWEAGSGGFPALNALGQFLIKDVALLGIALMVMGEAMASRASTAARSRTGT